MIRSKEGEEQPTQFVNDKLLMGENLEVVWAEFSTVSQAVLMITQKMRSMQMATYEVENLAQISSC